MTALPCGIALIAGLTATNCFVALVIVLIIAACFIMLAVCRVSSMFSRMEERQQTPRNDDD